MALPKRHRKQICKSDQFIKRAAKLKSISFRNDGKGEIILNGSYHSLSYWSKK